MAQQTAIEWLIEQYNQYRPGQMPKSKFKEVCEKAKAMEKEQMIDFAEQWQKRQNESDIDSIEDLYYKTYDK